MLYFGSSTTKGNPVQELLEVLANWADVVQPYLKDPQAIEAIGWGGNVVFLLAIYLNTTGRMPGEGKAFNVMILAQSAVFVVYAYLKEAFPYVSVEIILALIALNALLRGRRRG